MDVRLLWIVLVSVVVGLNAISLDLKSSDAVQGVHLALAGPNSVRVTWLNPAFNTLANFHPVCRFGTQANSLTQNVQGRPYSYPEGGFVETLNTAILNLSVLRNQFQKVYYQCGDTAYSFGQIRSFELMQKVPVPNQPSMDSGEGKLIAFVGDMALAMSLNTMQAVQTRVRSGEVKMIVHEGDITYADGRLSTYGARYGSTWANYMYDFQGAISGAMYMTVPGNHEDDHGFAAYRNWLLMPYRESGSNSPYWYSYDYMGIHFTMFSTEHPFQNGSAQNSWIKQDIVRANQNRANVPWLIVVAHQPLYCTSLIKWKRCSKEAVVKREILEPILRANLVDVYINGHNHNYERTWPVYNSRRTQTNYNNPSATVYITNGAGGGPIVNDPTFMPFQSTRAYGYSTFYNGFLLMQPLANELRFQYIKSRDGTVVDRFVITKTVSK